MRSKGLLPVALLATFAVLAVGTWWLRGSAPTSFSVASAAGVDAASEPGTEGLAIDGTTSSALAQFSPMAIVSREELAPTPFVRGKVIDIDRHAPVAGAEVRLLSFHRVVSSTRSDARGRFVLSLPDEIALWVQVVAPEGLEALEPRVRLRGDEAPADELVLSLRRKTSAPFLGRAVDATTGEPLARLEVEIGRDDLDRDVVVTDERGNFASPRDWEPGRLAVSAPAMGAQRSDQDREVEHDASGTRRDVRFLVGPTYDLRLELPPECELDGLHAYLRKDAGARRRSMYSDEFEDAAVLQGDPPWVRFPVLQPSGGSDAPLQLVIADDGWGCAGSVTVPRVSSHGSGVYRVVLQRCDAVEGRVVTSSGDPVAGVEVELSSAEPGRDVTWDRTGPGGSFGLALLPSGDYVLKATCERFEPLERTLRLPLEDGSNVELVLRAARGR